MLRKQLLADVAAVERGEDPKGVIRDPAKALNIELPTADRALLVDGAPLADYAKHPMFSHHLHEFLFQAGQPRAVWEDYCATMGIAPDGSAVPAPATARFGVVQEAE